MGPDPLRPNKFVPTTTTVMVFTDPEGLSNKPPNHRHLQWKYIKLHFRPGNPGRMAQGQIYSEEGRVTKPKKSSVMNDKLHQFSDSVGNFMVDLFHYVALFVIGGSIVWSAVAAFIEMSSKGHASIEDILLLFIYLELGAMVGIYFKTNHMPVRFLVYVAITALTRMLIGDIQANHEPDLGILYITGSILLLAFANLVVRYGSAKFPSSKSDTLSDKDESV